MKVAYKRRIAALSAGPIIAASVLAGCGSGDDSGDSKAYYAGKTIDIISTATPGKASDTLARVLAEFLPKYIEGSPKVRVVSITGANGIQGANEFAKRKPDGTTLLVVSDSTAIPYIVGSKQLKLDLADTTALFTVPTGKAVYVRSDTGITSYKQLLNPPVKLVNPGSTPESDDLLTSSMLEALGIQKNVKNVYGYDGASAASQSVVSGENNFDGFNVGTLLKSAGPKFKDGTLKMLFDTGVQDANGKFVEDPNLPGVPTAEDVYRDFNNGAEPSGEAWNGFVALFSMLAQSIVADNDIPAKATDALNQGFAKVVTDKKVLASIHDNVPYTPSGGPAAKAWTDTITKIHNDKATVAWLDNFSKSLG